MVAGHCGGGGCGMKKEGMSLFVMCVTFGSTCDRIWITLTLKFVVSAFSDYKNLQCPLFSLQNFVVFAFGTSKIHSLLFFIITLCNIHFSIKKLCSITFL